MQQICRVRFKLTKHLRSTLFNWYQKTKANSLKFKINRCLIKREVKLSQTLKQYHQEMRYQTLQLLMEVMTKSQIRDISTLTHQTAIIWRSLRDLTHQIIQMSSLSSQELRIWIKLEGLTFSLLHYSNLSLSLQFRSLLLFRISNQIPQLRFKAVTQADLQPIHNHSP